MNVESNNTAETVTEQTDHGNIITIQTTLGDEDEDVHRCGRCQSEFCTLEAFIQHKLHNSCQRPQDLQIPRKDPQEHSQEVVSSHRGSVTTIGEEERSVSPETDQRQGIDVASDCVAASAGRRRRHGTGKVLSHSEKTAALPNDGSEVKIAFKANREGRYLCQICEKTFKTPNILRTHMSTHCEKKNFNCNLCGSAFRTKGSLIRHNRRHTDERPYRCNLCGLSFRESGALTRHLKSITPCTEKIRFSQCQEILVNKDGVQKGVEEEPSGFVPPEGDRLPAESMEDSSGETIHEVHIKMDQQVEEEQAQAVAEGDSLICQAIINSGIALESEDGERAEGKYPKQASQSHDPENRLTEIQMTEECVEMDSDEAGDTEDRSDELTSSKAHKCPHCNRVFKAINYLRVHVKGHLGYRPFKCMVCGKEFLTGYLLKKHMEAHLSERRFKCGECGKLYKTIGHVREHMRAHSDDRPYHCNRCSKGYKTKNALQVHQRTHAQERPYVCQFCSRAFREKGSLVRHIRHHTGEKPFKCYKCGRGFAEHGTLNRHLRAKGGCFGGLKESEQAVVSEEPVPADSVAATIISEDPHAVLVEFSSVVADTQEYIIGAPSDVSGAGGEAALIPDSRHEMGSHIMKVVQQIVNQSSGQHQIIVQNVSVDEGAGVSADCSDTITIATPESLTEQVAMTLASAIGDGTILTAGGALEAADGTVTMVTSQDIEVMEQAEEFVITSPEEVEIQTVIVQD